jgi:Xaa-Pro aminopeptidase
MTATMEPALRPAISPRRYAARLDAVREHLGAAGGASLVVGPGSDLLYLAGYHAPALERLTVLVVPPAGDALLIVPRLEREPAEASPLATAGLAVVRSWEETEDPFDLVAEAIAPSMSSGRHGPPGLLVGERMWAMFVLPLRDRFPAARLDLAAEVLARLRILKDAEEIELLRAAAHGADRVVAGIAAARLVGRTERDVAREVVERLVDEGHEGADHDQIVGGGPNSASPHHTAGDRVIVGGEPLLLDIGGTLGGYQSDITRVLWVSGPERRAPDPAYARIYETVRAAHAAAVAAVRPGVACEAIDAAAREIIVEAGHGPEFVHRTGHGIGLEVHEDPYLVAGNRAPLEAGMAFSIEPGIYLEGRHGARIEDIAACTADGIDVFNEAPRELLVVPG